MKAVARTGVCPGGRCVRVRPGVLQNSGALIPAANVMGDVPAAAGLCGCRAGPMRPAWRPIDLLGGGAGRGGSHVSSARGIGRKRSRMAGAFVIDFAVRRVRSAVSHGNARSVSGGLRSLAAPRAGIGNERGAALFWIMGASFVAVYGLLAGLIRFSESIIRTREGGNA